MRLYSLTDVSAVRFLQSLERLEFLKCEELRDIRPVVWLPKLTKGFYALECRCYYSDKLGKFLENRAKELGS